MRPRLKVQCFKKSGKLAYTNGDKGVEVKSNLYSTIYELPKETTLGELPVIQAKQAYELGNLIRNNDPLVQYLSPEGFGFANNYIYYIDLQLKDHQWGFCTFFMDRLDNEI